MGFVDGLSEKLTLAVNSMTLTEDDTNDWQYFEVARRLKDRMAPYPVPVEFHERELPAMVDALVHVVARMPRTAEAVQHVAGFIAQCRALAAETSGAARLRFEAALERLEAELVASNVSNPSDDSSDASERRVRDLLNDIERTKNGGPFHGADPRMHAFLAAMEKAMGSELLGSVASAWLGPLVRAMPAVDSYVAPGTAVDAQRLATRLHDVYGRVREAMYTGDVALLAALVDRVLGLLDDHPAEGQKWTVLGWQHLRQILDLKTDVTHFRVFVTDTQRLLDDAIHLLTGAAARTDAPRSHAALREFTKTVATGTELAALAAQQFEVPRTLLQSLIATYQPLLDVCAQWHFETGGLERGVAALRDAAEQAPSYDDPAPAVRVLPALAVAQLALNGQLRGYHVEVGDMEAYVAGTAALLTDAVDRLSVLDRASGRYDDVLVYTYVYPFVEALAAGSEQLVEKMAGRSVNGNLGMPYLSSYKKLAQLVQQKDLDIGRLREHLAVFE